MLESTDQKALEVFDRVFPAVTLERFRDRQKSVLPSLQSQRLPLLTTRLVGQLPSCNAKAPRPHLDRRFPKGVSRIPGLIRTPVWEAERIPSCRVILGHTQPRFLLPTKCQRAKEKDTLSIAFQVEASCFRPASKSQKRQADGKVSAGIVFDLTIRGPGGS